MALTQQIAKHFRDVHFGGNWTTSALKEHLEDITWQEATKKIQSFNTIAVLTYHINYYTSEVLKVLQGRPLEASDKFSFACPPIQSAEDWKAVLDKMWHDAEAFASLVEKLPEEKLAEDLADPKYGTWFRNLSGIIEHTHYHLGQIVILKKLLRNEKA